MAKGDKKDYIARTFRLSPKVLDKLDEYSERTGVPRTFVVEKALLAYLEGNTEKGARPDA